MTGVAREAHAGHRPGAGILFRHDDTDGDWWLLGRRAARLGGTWSNIGGTVERGETAWQAAAREVVEELWWPTNRALRLRMRQTINCGTPLRPYTMFVVNAPQAWDDAWLNDEHTDLAWWPGAAVDGLDLHAGFRRGWAEVDR